MLSKLDVVRARLGHLAHIKLLIVVKFEDNSVSFAVTRERNDICGSTVAQKANEVAYGDEEDDYCDYLSH